MTEVLAGLDLATRKSGWCVGSGETRPQASAWLWDQTGADLGRMLEFLDADLRVLIETHRPAAIAYESPIKRPIDGLLKLRKLYNLGGHVEWVCRRRGIDCVEVGVDEVKKELAGFSGAGKADMVAAAVKVGIELPATVAAGREDAADAFAVWLALLRHRNRAISARWDQLLWGRRGALL